MYKYIWVTSDGFVCQSDIEPTQEELATQFEEDVIILRIQIDVGGMVVESYDDELWLPVETKND